MLARLYSVLKAFGAFLPVQNLFMTLVTVHIVTLLQHCQMGNAEVSRQKVKNIEFCGNYCAGVIVLYIHQYFIL